MKGIFVPMITPFRKDLSLDLEGLKWLINYLESNGVDGIFVNSSVGEFVHLSKDEVSILAKVTREEAKTKVLVGISSNTTEDVVSLGKEMLDIGADALVVTTPFFFKIKDELIRYHFSLIAEKLSNIPIILYNIPMFTGLTINLKVYEELVREYSNIVGTKVTMDSLSFLKSLVLNIKSIRKDFSILTGLDEYLLPLIQMGGDGGIVGLANVIPWIHVKLMRDYKDGRISNAIELWIKVLRALKIYEFCSSYSSSLKSALKVMNAPISNLVRPPLLPCSEAEEGLIRGVLMSEGFLEYNVS
jgi:4-hydroxy-tetrahydrodipicolinate synthase